MNEGKLHLTFMDTFIHTLIGGYLRAWLDYHVKQIVKFSYLMTFKSVQILFMFKLMILQIYTYINLLL